MGQSFTVNLWPADDSKVFVKFSKPASDDGSCLNGRAGIADDGARPATTQDTRMKYGGVKRH